MSLAVLYIFLGIIPGSINAVRKHVPIDTTISRNVFVKIGSVAASPKGSESE
jgi:hypothetical protein